MDAEAAFFNYRLDFGNTRFGTIDNFQGATRDKTTTYNGKHNCSKKLNILAIKRAIDEYSPRFLHVVSTRFGGRATDVANRFLKFADGEILRLECRPKNTRSVGGLA